MVRQFAPPVNVSSLIRFGRWGMLFTGIVYGAYRHRYLQKYEDERHQLKRQRDDASDRSILEATTAPGEGGINDDACSVDRKNTIITENPIPVDLKNTATSLVPKDPSDERRKVVIDNTISGDQKKTNSAVILQDPFDEHRNITIPDDPLTSRNTSVDLKKTAASLVPKDPSDERRKFIVDNPISSVTGEINPANVVEDPTNGGRNVVIDNLISVDQKKTDSAVILKDPFDEHRNITILDVKKRDLNEGADKSEENDSNGFIVS